VSGHKVLAQELAELEPKAGAQDEQIGALAETIRQLGFPVEPKRH
jgi:hypothetical protein